MTLQVISLELGLGFRGTGTDILNLTLRITLGLGWD